MEVAPEAPDVGQTLSSPSSAQHLPQAQCSGTPPCTLQKSTAAQEMPLGSLCKTLQ